MSQSIGSAAATVGITADTLRYYEKIGLLPHQARNASGRRVYREKDLARLRFVKRAQALGFSLQDIRQLLRLRENPIKCSKAVRALAQEKRDSLLIQMRETERMQAELTLLLNLCTGADDSCPILDRLAQDESRPASTD
jgi:MerR family copper efflux transcriptional regulator